jgi:hypothetical protein
VQQLHDWDVGFDQFFQKLAALGINPSNTVFVFHSDENDQYAGGVDSRTWPTTRTCVRH